MAILMLVLLWHEIPEHSRYLSLLLHLIPSAEEADPRTAREQATEQGQRLGALAADFSSPGQIQVRQMLVSSWL